VRVLEVELAGALSSPQALRIAVAEAVRKALIRAGGRVLRPVMTTEVVVPESDVGMVMGDLQARRAVIRDTTSLGDSDPGHDQFRGYDHYPLRLRTGPVARLYHRSTRYDPRPRSVHHDL